MSVARRNRYCVTKLAILTLIMIFLVSPAVTPNAHAYSFAMPEEHVNYMITYIDGALWAKIDGIYPIIYTGNETSIPMVYPTPPGTTNISVWLNNEGLDWSNLTEEQPNALHHTAIGDWSEILTVLQHVSGDFVLKIHYEHPLQVINGSYTFLYDLNIQEYLSAEQNVSVAHFTLTMDLDYANLKVVTVDPETETLKPIAFTVSGERPAEVRIDEISEFNTPVPGDLLVSFSEKKTSNSYTLIVTAFALVVGIATAIAASYVFVWRRRNQQLH